MVELESDKSITLSQKGVTNDVTHTKFVEKQ